GVTNRQLLDESKSDEETPLSLPEWLENNQPCLFGRAGAKLDLLSFCIIREHDLEQSDTHIRDKIQRFRLLWRREAFRGRRSGFLMLSVSPRIPLAQPD